MIELFDAGISGNSHKIRMMLSSLGLEYTTRAVNLVEREQKSVEFFAMNPFGQVPVLRDGEVVVRDSQAILVYLARAYGDEYWFPMDAEKAAEVTAWLSIAANEVARGPSALRAHYKIGRAINIEDATNITQQLLLILNQHLAQRDWLANNAVSIADIAIYPYIALANEGKVDLSPFANVQKWLARVEMLSGYVSMPGIQLQKM